MNKFILLIIYILLSMSSGDILAAETLGGEAMLAADNQVSHSIMILLKRSDKKLVSSGSRLTRYQSRHLYHASAKDKKLIKKIGQDYNIEYVTDWPITELGVICAVYRVSETEIVEKLLAKMQVDNRVQLAQKMMIHKTLSRNKSIPNNDPYYAIQAKRQYANLAEIHKITTGRNISIAVIDTGIDLEHPDLRGQFGLSQNFAENISPNFTSDIHGTAIAGVIAAKRNNGVGIVGVAPNAQLFAFKACWPLQYGKVESLCNTLTIALAINEALVSGADVINLSLTGPYDPILAALIDKSVERGIMVVASESITESNIEGFPASMPGVISVSTQTSQKSHSSVVAPGVQIVSTIPNGSYDFFSGNSFAAAHVSGLVALIKQRCPGISQQDISKRLLQSSSDINSKLLGLLSPSFCNS